MQISGFETQSEKTRNTETIEDFPLLVISETHWPGLTNIEKNRSDKLLI